MPSTLDPTKVPARTGTAYPPTYADHVRGREKRVLGDPFGLTQFGVNLTTLAPGAWSSHRHAHDEEDEFVHVLEGELVLIDDHGEHGLKAGMCAGFKAGSANAHHLVNRSDKPATYLEVGTRASDDHVTYADVDMELTKTGGGSWRVTRKDGTPF